MAPDSFCSNDFQLIQRYRADAPRSPAGRNFVVTIVHKNQVWNRRTIEQGTAKDEVKRRRWGVWQRGLSSIRHLKIRRSLFSCSFVPFLHSINPVPSKRNAGQTGIRPEPLALSPVRADQGAYAPRSPYFLRDFCFFLGAPRGCPLGPDLAGTAAGSAAPGEPGAGALGSSFRSAIPQVLDAMK